MTDRDAATTRDLALPEVAFAGPLELLLSLIEKRELDISRLSLVAVTDQYIAYLHAGDGFDPDEAADFLVIGARLLLLKSLSLLPTEQTDEPAEDDPGEELTRLLMEYQRVKQLAQDLREIEGQGLRSYGRVAPLAPPEVERPLAPIDGDRLLKALERALARQPRQPDLVAAVQQKTIDTQMALIRERLAGRASLAFDEILDECTTRTEVVLSFLALLELLKKGELDVQQEATFGPILMLAVSPTE
jgi:segregation and condensation protein A